MRISSWNINSISVRLPQIIQLMENHSVDILAVQETKINDDMFPKEIIRKAGFGCYFEGQKQFNGVAFITKNSFYSSYVPEPFALDQEKRILALRVGNKLEIVNVYVPNGRSLNSESFLYKVSWLKKLIFFLNSLRKKKNLIILGDFNMIFNVLDVSKDLDGGIGCSEVEKKLLELITKVGFIDCFRLINGNIPDKYTWWDYRKRSFQKNNGMRIDHILLSKNLEFLLEECYVCTSFRRNIRPSDHAPIMAKINFDHGAEGI